jgi:hypothetical protein
VQASGRVPDLSSGHRMAWAEVGFAREFGQGRHQSIVPVAQSVGKDWRRRRCSASRRRAARGDRQSLGKARAGDDNGGVQVVGCGVCCDVGHGRHGSPPALVRPTEKLSRLLSPLNRCRSPVNCRPTLKGTMAASAPAGVMRPGLCQTEESARGRAPPQAHGSRVPGERGPNRERPPALLSRRPLFRFHPGAPGRTRTCNLLIRSQTLCPLSYGRVSRTRGHYTTDRARNQMGGEVGTLVDW